jgi:hypothetical protein
MSEIKQPKPMISNGVRHVPPAAPDCEGLSRLSILVTCASVAEWVSKSDLA